MLLVQAGNVVSALLRTHVAAAWRFAHVLVQPDHPPRRREQRLAQHRRLNTDTLRQAVGMTQGSVVLEASGNMRLERTAEVAATGDHISVGALTHSVSVLNLGMDF
jgi:hypothetical protein